MPVESFHIWKSALLMCLISASVFVHMSYGVEFKYHSNEEIEILLRNFSQNSERVRTKLYQIGETISGTGLWVLSLTATPEGRIGVPNVKLIGNMHGDEPVGRELLLQFIEYLLENYGANEYVTRLLNTTSIHVMPTLNPDGFARSDMKCLGSDSGRKVKVLPKHVDLNRNFPGHFYNNVNIITKVSESDAVMKWMENNTFILSAALHGGSFIVNYPFDYGRGTGNGGVESPTADDDVFKFLARTYSKTHAGNMSSGENCQENGPKFKDGITNGYFWKSVEGSMGDYNYAFHGCMELTIELYCCKYPKPDQLSKLWEDNREALLAFCLQANRGVSGQILDDDTNEPIGDANLTIQGRDMKFWSARNTGEFWRILLPGHYTLIVKVSGYNTKMVSFSVKDSKNAFPTPTFLEVRLQNSSSIPTPTSTAVPSSTGSYKEMVFWKIAEEEAQDVPTPELGMSISTGYSNKLNVINFMIFFFVNILI